MPIIARSSGSPWKKSAGSISASSSLVIRTVPNSIRSIDIFLTTYNDTQDVVKTMHYRLARESGSLKSTVHGRLGTLKMAINEVINGADIEVTVTNNETFDIDYEVASLILGG